MTKERPQPSLKLSILAPMGLGPWRRFATPSPTFLCLNHKWFRRGSTTQPLHQSREAGSCLGRKPAVSLSFRNRL